MSFGPPLGTLIVENVDALGTNAVIGIDTQFFTVQHFLKGIKLIPAGHHLLHYSASVEDGASMRYAWWFSCTENEVISVVWDEENVTFTRADPVKSDVGGLYQYMVTYPEDFGKWSLLTNFIDLEALEEYSPQSAQAITTATPSAEENMVLLETLRNKKPDISVTDQSASELKYTIIQSLKKRNGVFGEQLTRDVLDRSWYLAELFGHDPDLLLAEIQITFIHFIVLCNLCSYTQWMKLLELVSRSKQYLETNKEFADTFLTIFKVQLETLPEDYVLESSGVQVLEKDILESILSNFNECFKDQIKWNQILTFCQNRLEVSPIKESTLDADQFEVYDFSCYNEDDEDAPAIVF